MNRLRKFNSAPSLPEDFPLRRSAPPRQERERERKTRVPGADIHLTTRPTETLVLADIRHQPPSTGEQSHPAPALSLRKRTAMAILSGIALGLGATLLSLSFPFERSEMLESPLSAVSVTGEVAQLNVAASVSESALDLEGQSGAVEYAQGQAISLHEPRFLNVLESSSTYGPEFISPASGFSASEPAPSGHLPNLVPTGETGRYSAGHDTLQWQGFNLSDSPSRNVELGRAYHQYLSRGLSTSDLGGKTTSTQQRHTTTRGTSRR